MKSYFFLLLGVLDFKQSEQHREKVKRVTFHDTAVMVVVWCDVVDPGLCEGGPPIAAVFKSDKVNSKTPKLHWWKEGEVFTA